MSFPLRTLVDRLVPPALLAADADTQRRARLCVILNLASMVFGPAFGIAVWLGGIPVIPTFCVASSVLPLIWIGVLRRTQSLALIGHGMTAVAAMMMPAIAWATGGLRAPAVVMFPVVPLFAQFLAGRRAALGWALAMGGAAVGLYGLDCAGIRGPLTLSTDELAILQIATVVVALGVFLAISHLFDGVKADAFASLAAANADLAVARDAAEAANVAKGHFLANMSHEIRTPMTGVIGMTDILLESPLGEDQRHWAEIVRSSADTLLRIVNDILDVAKIEAGRIDIEVAPFDLPAEIQAVARLLYASAQTKGLALRAEIPSLLPQLLGDAIRLRQVLTNLVGNALKFTAEGEVCVTVEVLAARETDLALRVSVRDTGIGISTEVVGRVFQAFEQGDGSSTRRYGGTGLGLAISKRLIELMGGEIGVDSVPGRGSNFWFTLTLPRAPRPVKTPTRGLEPAARRTRILVAEDNPTNAQAVRHAIERLGLQVDVVPDGRAAVAAGEGGGYDLVLMDCQMPIMDGLEATRAIRGHEGGRGRTPIVALTAHASEGDRQRALEAGMDDHLVKPLHPDALRACLARLLGEAALSAVASADTPS